MNFFLAILKSACTKGIGKLWENKEHLALYLKTLFGSYRSKEIRFSISYLFRIRIPETDSYLLVLNRRISNQLQPVGGAYKRHGGDTLFEKWEFCRDSKQNGLGTDEKSENDLRFRVKGKYVIQVIEWFKEGKEREVSGEREFCEELLEPGILNREVFNCIQYRHIRRFSKELVWSDYHQCYEVLIYDVFELLPTSPQAEALKELAKEPINLEKGYAIVDQEQIERCRFIHEGVQIAKIGQHTRLIVNQKF